MDQFLAQIQVRPEVWRGYGTPRLCLIDKLQAGCSVGEPNTGHSSLEVLGANIWWLSNYLDVYLEAGIPEISGMVWSGLEWEIYSSGVGVEIILGVGTQLI